MYFLTIIFLNITLGCYKEQGFYVKPIYLCSCKLS